MRLQAGAAGITTDQVRDAAEQAVRSVIANARRNDRGTALHSGCSPIRSHQHRGDRLIWPIIPTALKPTVLDVVAASLSSRSSQA